MKKFKFLQTVCIAAVTLSVLAGCARSGNTSFSAGAGADSLADADTSTDSSLEKLTTANAPATPSATEKNAETTVPAQPTMSGTAAPTKPAAPETTAAAKQTAPETTVPAKPAAPETAAPTKPAAPETTAPTKPAAPETTAAAKPTASPAQTADHRLSNPNADKTTAKVYNYICEIYGSKMLSCQQESTWMGSPDYEMDYILKTTGKLPAMRGLDYMNNDFKGVNRRAIEWWKKGGLVTICWHTGVNGSGYQESLDDHPDFDKLLTEGTDEYNAMMRSWDEAAKALAELRDAGVPVLWRPFHEFDGQWFWWGKGGSENFVKLWRLMYDKFTYEYGLTNLIWVLGYSGEVRNGWYVGDEYCDIIGSDTYDNSTNLRAWKKLAALQTKKPMAFHECGNVPGIDKFVSDGCIWSWFMIWHTDFIKNNDQKNLTAVYNNDMVVTLDELPKF